MATRPYVSVVLPVWNSEAYLAEAVRSVLAQTFTDFELIIVDDGSTDRSPEIALEFARDDDRVVVMRREHAGIVASLNAGLAAARGEYLARMDADDIAAPERLACQVDYLDRNPRCVAVGSSIEVIDEQANVIGTLQLPTSHDAIVAAMVNRVGSGLVHPSVLMRRAAVGSVGGYRGDQYPAEDLDLWLRIMEIGELANLDRPLLRYRRHPRAIGFVTTSEQQDQSVRVRNRVRAERGLAPLEARRSPRGVNAAGRYHFQCATIALRSGNRAAALHHARASRRHAPAWPMPYAAIVACVLPSRVGAQMLRFYRWLRHTYVAITSASRR